MPQLGLRGPEFHQGLWVARLGLILGSYPHSPPTPQSIPTLEPGPVHLMCGSDLITLSQSRHQLWLPTASGEDLGPPPDHRAIGSALPTLLSSLTSQDTTPPPSTPVTQNYS